MLSDAGEERDYFIEVYLKSQLGEIPGDLKQELRKLDCKALYDLGGLVKLAIGRAKGGAR